MKLVELTEFLIKNLVKDPETVSVKKFDSEEDIVLIEVLVNSEDIGKIIGAQGKRINNIRTIVQAASSLNEGKLVRINVDSY